MTTSPHDTSETAYRMMGGETEYTIPFDEGWGQLSMFTPKGSILANDYGDNYWLANGARLYYDQGDVLEYATPECRDADQLVIHEKAGERTAAAITQEAYKYHKNTPNVKDWATYKRTAYDDVWDKSGHRLLRAMSTGHHENYETHMFSLRNDRMSAEMESYLATRAIWSGAGLVGNNGYEIYQKAFGITTECISQSPLLKDRSSHGQKCILLQPQGEGRLEVRLGDGNMSPWAIRAKYGMTSFVLRLIEHGEYPEELVLPTVRGPLRRALSHTPDMEFPNIFNEMLTATDHQRRIARACLDFTAKYPKYKIPTSEIRSAEHIELIATEIEAYFDDHGELPRIADRIDWAAKLHHLHERGLRDDAISAYNLDAVMHDLKWEEVGEHTASNRWYRHVGNTIDAREITTAQRTPPNTRARRRTETLKKYEHISDEFKSISWSAMKVFNNSNSFESGPIMFDDDAR